jgi:hypothetical protein
MKTLGSMDTGEEETPPPMIIGRIDEESPALMSAIDHNSTPNR